MNNAIGCGDITFFTGDLNSLFNNTIEFVLIQHHILVNQFDADHFLRQKCFMRWYGNDIPQKFQP